MKKVLWVLSGIFLILTIIFYVNSIHNVSYGNSSMNVANIQMTVFTAASAVLCGINAVGALLLTKMEDIHGSQVYTIEKLKEQLVGDSKGENPGASPSWSRTSFSPTQSTKPKKDCPYCGAKNNTDNTTCFACGKTFEK